VFVKEREIKSLDYLSEPTEIRMLHAEGAVVCVHVHQHLLSFHIRMYILLTHIRIQNINIAATIATRVHMHMHTLTHTTEA
jgi:hypothetical protein